MPSSAWLSAEPVPWSTARAILTCVEGGSPWRPASSSCTEDFPAWAISQAAALRRLAELRLNVPVDFDHLIEEVEDLAKAERNVARSQVRRIIEHCLKLEHSPAAEPRLGWKMSIDDASSEVADRLTPTIRRNVDAALSQLFAQARRMAAKALAAAGERHAADTLPPSKSLLRRCSPGRRLVPAQPPQPGRCSLMLRASKRANHPKQASLVP